MTKPVTIQLTGAQEDHLRSISSQPTASLETLVAEFVAQRLEYDAWFRREVQVGIDAADEGNLIQHEEVVARMEARRLEFEARAGKA
ncbi:hypothetical protein [Phenylobacterium sp.]|uniref:hypothetical protein n=1 Tax=Phenylobacterium sp. TaxID=1871053 RepID=UPI0011FAFE83|nr:hypothetical protein [Phenylobacterium sp.]TAL29177.1 MAG: hypothetical protein EPN98_21215 [Phenylobacterium sp.]